MDLTRIQVTMEPVNSLTVHSLSHEIFGQMLPDDFDELKDDIGKRGLMYPIETDYMRRIICGSQRYKAVCELGWEAVPVIARNELVDEEDIREHLVRDNLHRRHLIPSQKYRAAVEIERIETVRAKQRMALGVLPDTDSEEVCSEEHRVGSARAIAAKQVGVSESEYQRLKTVFESDNTDLQDAVDSGSVSLTGAAERIRKDSISRAQPLDKDNPKAPALCYKRVTMEFDKLKRFLEATPIENVGKVFYQDAADASYDLQQTLKYWVET